MKKIIALVLCLLMVVSLAACGGQETPKESTANTKQTETTEPTTEETTQPEVSSGPVETKPVETEPVETEPAFDTSWASNELELQIAEPTFETWEVKGLTEGDSWEIFVGDVYYDDAKSYANDLRSYGFSLNEEENDNYNGLAYIFNADNEADYHAELVFEAGDRDGRGFFYFENF